MEPTEVYKLITEGHDIYLPWTGEWISPAGGGRICVTDYRIGRDDIEDGRSDRVGPVSPYCYVKQYLNRSDYLVTGDDGEEAPDEGWYGGDIESVCIHAAAARAIIDPTWDDLEGAVAAEEREDWLRSVRLAALDGMGRRAPGLTKAMATDYLDNYLLEWMIEDAASAMAEAGYADLTEDADAVGRAIAADAWAHAAADADWNSEQFAGRCFSGDEWLSELDSIRSERDADQR